MSENRVRSGVCHIIGAGDPPDQPPELRPGDLVIAADGGADYCRRAGVPVDWWVGDGDSLSGSPEAARVVPLPREKDETDVLYALKLAMEEGYRRFFLYGSLGGARLSHTIANLQLLRYLLARGCTGMLVGQGCAVTAVENGSITLPEATAGFFSVFSLSEQAGGVSILGGKYELRDATLHNAFPLGVSNEFQGQAVEITVREGSLLVVSEWS